ncbi:MAG: TetR/AcrR family transcriptional regulator [Alphaproteobacteria bacterium]
MSAVAAETHPEPSSRDRILDAAEGLFARRGYAGVGLRELADLVGLGKSSLFHHFESKPQLYAAVCGRILARIAALVDESLAAGGAPMERLERVVDDLLDLLAARPNDARILLRSLFEDDELAGETREEREGQASTRHIMASISGLLREGMESGQFRSVHVPGLLLGLIGQTVFPFASGEFGQEILGKDPFDPVEVKRRKRETRDLLRHGLLAQGGR